MNFKQFPLVKDVVILESLESNQVSSRNELQEKKNGIGEFTD